MTNNCTLMPTVSLLIRSRALSYSRIVHSWFIWKNLQINWKYKTSFEN